MYYTDTYSFLLYSGITEIQCHVTFRSAFNYELYYLIL